jgi:DnaJ-class molecular chaperone
MSENAKEEKSLADLPELETICQRCSGRGKEDEVGTYRTYNCPDCRGVGYHPTGFGKKVLALIRHNSVTF